MSQEAQRNRLKTETETEPCFLSGSDNQFGASLEWTSNDLAFGLDQSRSDRSDTKLMGIPIGQTCQSLLGNHSLRNSTPKLIYFGNLANLLNVLLFAVLESPIAETSTSKVFTYSSVSSSASTLNCRNYTAWPAAQQSQSPPVPISIAIPIPMAIAITI